MANTLTPGSMKVGCAYNWKGQSDQLIYLGRNWSGNGYWHQFRKIGDHLDVWCEVLDSDLSMLEETQSPADPHATSANTPSVLTSVEAWNAMVDARKAAKRARKATHD